MTPSAHLNVLTPSPIEIIDDGRGVGAALAKVLARRGYLASLVDDVDESASSTPQIIDLRGLAPVESIDDALAVQRAAFQTARAAADDTETFVVAFDTGGTFALSSSPDAVVTGPRAWLGGLSALAKTANLEWENTTVRAIDVDTDGADPKSVARRIADELTDGGAAVEVALDADGTRHTVRTRRIEADDTATPTLGADDVVVASGGARGVTARCLIELAEQCRPAIVLLGRTPLKDEPEITHHAKTDAEVKGALIEAARAEGETPSPKEIGRKAAGILKQREIRATVDAIAAAGSEVRYVTADVRDREALREALEEIRAGLGDPTAVVHAAGVLADKSIADKTDDQFDFVFDTKVDGLRALLEVAAEDPIEHLIMFSSVAARTGNVGQVDYAMANETLNKVARAESLRRGLRARSLNWGPWDGGMVDDSLRAHFESQGVSLIDLDGGAQAFCLELIGNNDEQSIEVVLGDGLPEAAGGLCATISFDALSHAELAGHAIDGTVVVPAAVVVDHLTGLARATRPEQRLQRLHDVRVFKGIQLPDFGDSTESARFTAIATPAEDDSVTLELRAIDGTPHYRAVAEFGDHEPTAEFLDVDEDLGKENDVDEIHEKFLFHTDDFRVIDSFHGLGDETARAQLRATTRPVALDAGIQVARTQAMAADGRSSLPTAIESYKSLDFPRDVERLDLIVKTRETTTHKTVFDVDFVDADGKLVAAIRGLVMHFHGE